MPKNMANNEAPRPEKRSLGYYIDALVRHYAGGRKGETPTARSFGRVFAVVVLLAVLFAALTVADILAGGFSHTETAAVVVLGAVVTVLLLVVAVRAFRLWKGAK